MKSTVIILWCFVFSANYGLAQQQNAKQIEDYEVTEIVSGLNYPWSMAFLSEHHILLTERSGQLRQLVNRVLGQPVTGLPDDIYVKSQGGLLDVQIHPDFAQNRLIYLSYAAGTDEQNHLRVARAKLVDNSLKDLQVIFRLTPLKNTPVHYGGRMVFLPDNSLVITTGDGFDFREDAQRLDNQRGKLIRIHDDGSIPQNNPFNNDEHGELAAYVYSLGHRNPQGLVYDKYRDWLIAHEHGPAGGDEINLIEAGENYGWPVITNGMDYSGATISPFTEYPGMQQPWLDWTPSIAPSGIDVYYGSFFPSLRGDLLIGVLKSKEVRWVQLDGKQIVAQVSLFKELNARIRDVKVHPDGSIYLLTDSADGKLLRVAPKF